MKTELLYDDHSDQELYLQEKLVLSNLSLNVVAATVAGYSERPNEDTFALARDGDVMFVAVFDGTTSLKPIAALDNQSGARFASHFLKNNLAAARPNTSAEDVMQELNNKLLKASTELGGTLTDTHTLPASVATIVRFNKGDGFFSFAHVGDSFGIAYYEDGHSHVFTDDKNAVFDNSMFSLIAKVAGEQGITPRKAREDERVKSALIDMFIGRNNNPNGRGSGLVNGDPNLEKYIQTGSLTLQGVTAILLGSDGLLPPGWSLEDEEDRQKMRTAIDDGGFRKLFSIKHAVEDSDPDWQHVRFKHSDDATGLFIEL
jgi:serine/threonine protein phosphatase PrpC